MTPLHPDQPVNADERLVLLDALRGFALFGILFVNLTWFSGYAVLPRDGQISLTTMGIDVAVNWLIHFLVEGKFWSLFALLFGVGVAVQVNRLARRGTDFRRLMTRRLAVLLLIGSGHAVLVWFGDIVSLYAVVGFALLLFVRCSDRRVLVWALVFFALPILQGGVWLLVDQASQATQVPVVDPGHGPADLITSFSSGTYAEALVANWAFLKERWFLALYEGRFFKLLGMFLVGYWTGRRGILHNPDAHRRLFLRVFTIGLLIGLPTNAISAWAAESVPLRPPSYAGWAVGVARSLGFPALCLTYAAGLALWLSARAPGRGVQLLVHAGRMSLTNYVMQSVIGVSVFYGCGLGLWGRSDSTALVVLALVIFGAQSCISAAWLRAFRYGPLEWVWRCITYGRRLALRKGSPALRAGGSHVPFVRGSR